MGRLLFLASASVVLFSFYNAETIQAGEKKPRSVVRKYFAYLKKGDTEGILGLLANPLLSQKRELLEGNTHYPRFLRGIYKNSRIKIAKTRRIKRHKRAVDVRIYFSPKERPLKIRFILKRKRVDGQWKVSKEIFN
jgi:hypothetical protein